jgi:DNA-binding SARP family transcriptional activator
VRAQGGRARLRLGLFGPLRVSVDGRPASALSPKARAVLGLLALSPEGMAERAAAARMLWPGATDASARVALRQCLHGLRGALEAAGFDGLAAGRSRLALDPARLDTDVADVLAAAAAGEAHAALLAGADPFETLLEETEGLGEAFAAWRAAARDRVRAEARRNLSAALAAPRGRDARLALAEALWTVDPLGEAAARALMAAYAARGETARAFEVYDALWRRLGAALDAEPSDETQRLLERLKRGDAAPDEGRRPPGAPRGVTVAVAPVEAPADAPDAAAAAALLRRELVARLAAFDGVGAREGAPAAGEAEVRATLAPDGDGWRAVATLARAQGAPIAAAARARLPAESWADAVEALALRLAARLAPAARPGALEDALAPLLRAGEAAPTGRGLMARAVEAGWPAAADEALEAAAAAAAAVAADPLSSEARRDAAWAALALSRFDAAAAGFELAAAMNPADGRGLAEAALGLSLCGREREARLAVDAVAALRPLPAPAVALRALARVVLGQGTPAPGGPPLLVAWAAAALPAGDPAAAAAAAGLRDGAPDDALAARLAGALPDAVPGRAAAREAALRAALRASWRSAGS